MRNAFVLGVFLFCAGILLSTSASAELRMPNLFSDHMVLQREKPIPVWGWEAPGEKVSVSFAGQSKTAIADEAGCWEIKLDALEADAKGRTMEITGKTRITLNDILVGEVWVCSGQSNMDFQLKIADNGEQEVNDADYPQIRLLHVPITPASLPLDDVDARWFRCKPSNPLRTFSAVGYFFARDIHRALNVPVGMIAAARGATQIEIWTPPEKTATPAERAEIVKNLDEMEAAIRRARIALATERPMPSELVKVSLIPNTLVGSALYNGMISPLVPYAIRGALWYQGESNCGDGMRYLDKKKTLIGAWRKVWGQGDFPFYFVQITPNRYNGALPFLLEAQNAAMLIKNTGMAASTDTCDASKNYGGGHPSNKQEIGRRLALWALAKDYGRKDLVYCGPSWRTVVTEEGKLRISFDHVGGGLVTRGNRAPDHFEIAGDDETYVPAEAKIEGQTVVISSKDVSKPSAMRFAWHDLAQPNLMNKEGLPVSVFRAKAGETNPRSVMESRP